MTKSQLVDAGQARTGPTGTQREDAVEAVVEQIAATRVPTFAPAAGLEHAVRA